MGVILALLKREPSARCRRLISTGRPAAHRSHAGSGRSRQLSAGSHRGRAASANPDGQRAIALREERQLRANPLSARWECCDWDHRLASGMYGLDDFGVVDALQVDRRDAEVAVAELALDDD
jgi:hypothetical protein